MSASNVEDLGSIPGLGRSPGEGNGNPLQYSCLENPMDGGAWWATVRGGHKESDMTERLHFHFHLAPFFTNVYYPILNIHLSVPHKHLLRQISISSPCAPLFSYT